MIQNALQTLGGIQGYGIISLCLFFGVFACSLLWAFTRKQTHLQAMARLPLEDAEQHPDEKESQ